MIFLLNYTKIKEIIQEQGLIFLKKFISFTALLTATVLFMTGCADKSSVPDKKSSAEATSQPFTERAVEKTDGTYIFDDAGILSAEDFRACNDYAGWLYEEKLINAAVVTVSNLNGKAPYDYAAEQYNKLYEGKGSGLLVLVNNDTKEDIVYRSGAALNSITQKQQDNALFWATKEFITGANRKGIMRLLQLGELSTSHIIDNALLFDEKQLASLEKLLASCKHECTVLATKNLSSKPDKDIAREYYDRKYKGKDGIMFMLDTEKKSLEAYSESKMPKDSAETLKAANDMASKEQYYEAVKKIAEGLGADQ